MTPSERRAERDHRVRLDLGDDADVYDSIKRDLRRGARRSWTEAAQEWIAENGARVAEIRHARIERWARTLEQPEPDALDDTSFDPASWTADPTLCLRVEVPPARTLADAFRSACEWLEVPDAWISDITPPSEEWG